MPIRKLVPLGAAGLFVAVLAAGLALQRGSAQAANLAQVTETATDLVTATAIATDIVTATDIATATDVVTATDVATATATATAPATATAIPTTTPLAPTPPGTPLPPADMPARTLTVTGMGEASAAPDEAFVSVGVQTDADTAAEALEQNNAQMQALIDALVEAGIPEADIQTQFVSLYPRYADSSGDGTTTGIVGYTAVNSVEARVSDLDTLGDLLDTAVAAGANTIGGIRFSVSDPNEVTSQARAEAMADARDKAQQLASLAGATLGPVLSISEGFQGGPIFGGGADRGGAEVPIAPGSQTLQINVEVTWLLR